VLYCTRHKADVVSWGSLLKQEHERKVEEKRIKKEQQGKEDPESKTERFWI